MLPELTDAAAGAATTEQLATHTSGLPRLGPSVRTVIGTLLFGLFGVDPYRGFDTAEVLRTTRRVRRRLGTHRAYSNLGAALAGAAAASAAHTSHPDLLRERILTPLGMTRTSAAGDLPVRRGRGRGWVVASWRLDGYAPAGGAVSTAADLTRLCVAMLDWSAPGAAAMDPVDVLDPEQPQRRQGPFWINDAVPGSDRTAIWHNGEAGGYSAFLAVYPQVHRAVVVLSSVADSAATERIAVAARRAGFQAPRRVARR